MPRIYLDTNIWCRPFDVPSGRINREKEAFYKILEKVHEGEFTIGGSVVLDYEVEDIKQREKQTAVKMSVDKFVSKKIDYIPKIYKDIIKKADRIKLYGIKVKNPVKFLMEGR